MPYKEIVGHKFFGETVHTADGWVNRLTGYVKGKVVQVVSPVDSDVATITIQGKMIGQFKLDDVGFAIKTKLGL